MRNILSIQLLFILFAGKISAQEEYESCSFEAEQAWEGDSTALHNFISGCGHIDTLNYDESSQLSAKKPAYQTIRLVLNNGKVLKTDSVFFFPQEMPEFKGKEAGLVQYFSKNLHYPEIARKNKTHGTVYVSFTVERNGLTSHVKIKRGIGSGCDEEAIRLVREMPEWIPGKNNKLPVRVQLTIPVLFSVNKK